MNTQELNRAALLTDLEQQSQVSKSNLTQDDITAALWLIGEGLAVYQGDSLIRSNNRLKGAHRELLSQYDTEILKVVYR